MNALKRYCPIALFCLATLFVNTSNAVVAEEKAAAVKENVKAVDPSGTWRWEHEMGGETINDVLKLNFDGKKLTGTYQGRREPVEITNGKVEKNQVTFEFVLEFEGQKITVKFDGKIKENAVDGEIMWESADDSGEFPWSAKRSLMPEDVVGIWNLEIETPERTLAPILTLKLDGDKKKLSGEYQAGGDVDLEFDVSEIMVKDDRLSFKINGEFDGNTLTAKYKVQPLGNKLAGEIEYDFNGQTGELKVTGKQKTEKKKEK